MNTLSVGDRVRAKVRTVFGRWKGTGTVVRIAGTVVDVRKDDVDETATFCRHEVAKIRNVR